MSEKHSRLDKTQVTCTCKCNNQIHEKHISLHNTVKRIFHILKISVSINNSFTLNFLCESSLDELRKNTN